MSFVFTTLSALLALLQLPLVISSQGVQATADNVAQALNAAALEAKADEIKIATVPELRRLARHLRRFHIEQQQLQQMPKSAVLRVPISDSIAEAVDDQPAYALDDVKEERAVRRRQRIRRRNINNKVRRTHRNKHIAKRRNSNNSSTKPKTTSAVSNILNPVKSKHKSSSLKRKINSNNSGDGNIYRRRLSTANSSSLSSAKKKRRYNKQSGKRTNKHKLQNNSKKSHSKTDKKRNNKKRNQQKKRQQQQQQQLHKEQNTQKGTQNEPMQNNGVAYQTPHKSYDQVIITNADDIEIAAPGELYEQAVSAV